MCEDFCTVGIDGGGSKTECAIVNSLGEVLGIGIGGSCNTNYVSAEEMRESIETACTQASEAVGPNRPKVVKVGGGVFRARHIIRKSLPSPSWVLEIEEFVRGMFESDLESLSEGEVALGCIEEYGRIGIACVAGTGSSCFGFTKEHDMIVRGGWGAPLGDEGSAFDIALHGLRAAGKAYEKRGPDTSLVELASAFFEQELNGRFLRGIGPRVQTRRREVAAFAKVISQAAEDGDRVAGQILGSAAEELGELIKCISRAIFTPEEAFPVALHGGVFNNNRVAERTRETVLGEFPNARITPPLHSPGVGAALLVAHDYRNGVC